jgi:L-lactate dehydrogenase complex protein LldG
MSARESILRKVRASLGQEATQGARAEAVADRLKRAPKGIIPVRGQLPQEERIALFCTTLTKLSATHERLKGYDGIPSAVATYLRAHNLPAGIRMGDDRRLSGAGWSKHRYLDVKVGPSDGKDEVGLSHARSAVAETGTLVLGSGSNNPTTLNFLPEHHIVVVDASDIDGDLEASIAKLRKRYGKGEMPRTVNLITGPSRSGDIEQKILLGAHGPRALHVIVVG